LADQTEGSLKGLFGIQRRCINFQRIRGGLQRCHGAIGVLRIPVADFGFHLGVQTDFDVIDPLAADQGVGAELVTALIQKHVAGILLVVAGGRGESAGDGTFLADIAVNEGIPMLNVRLEDLAPAGVASWEALAAIETARLIWDTDVFTPGQSGNLVARIPGVDTSRAVILGAHIDSANTPGAGDNALNCAVLLEVARVYARTAWRMLGPKHDSSGRES